MWSNIFKKVFNQIHRSTCLDQQTMADGEA